MIVRIAVCDDDSAIGVQMEAYLTSLSHTFSVHSAIEVYTSGEALYQRLARREHFDIIFLDIEMEPLSGVEIGRRIRDEFRNETTQIIYISGRESYAMELFYSRPLNFLIKPLQADKVAQALQKALDLIRKGRRYFEVQSDRQLHKIPLHDILYFESTGKKIRLITPSVSMEFYGKLSAVEQQLDDNDFIAIHKSYLVNYHHVIRYTYKSVTLSNQTVLPVSQQNRQVVSKKLLQRREKGR